MAALTQHQIEPSVALKNLMSMHQSTVFRQLLSFHTIVHVPDVLKVLVKVVNPLLVMPKKHTVRKTVVKIRRL